MSPKLHRRTPSSAHTYRLLIFKEPANSSAFAALSNRFVRSAKKRNYAGLSEFRQAFCRLFFYPPALSGCFAHQPQSQLLWGTFFFPSSVCCTLFSDPISPPNWHSRTVLRPFMAFLKTVFLRGRRNVSKPAEVWQAFFDKRFHSLFLVLCREGAMKQTPLELYAFAQ